MASFADLIDGGGRWNPDDMLAPPSGYDSPYPDPGYEEPTSPGFTDPMSGVFVPNYNSPSAPDPRYATGPGGSFLPNLAPPPDTTPTYTPSPAGTEPVAPAPTQAAPTPTDTFVPPPPPPPPPPPAPEEPAPTDPFVPPPPPAAEEPAPTDPFVPPPPSGPSLPPVAPAPVLPPEPPPPPAPPEFLREFDPFTSTPSAAMPARLPSAMGGGRSIAQPGALNAYRPDMERAMRGLQRSPYAKWAFGRQPLSAPTFGRFSPEGQQTDEDEMRRAMQAAAAGQLPAWSGI